MSNLVNSAFRAAKLFRQLTKYLFWSLGWLFALSVMVWYSLHWLTGDRFLPVRLVSYIMPWLLAGLIPGAAMAGLGRRRWLALFLAIPAGLIGLTFAPLFLPPSTTALAGGVPLKVMSHNVWYGNSDVSGLGRVIRREQPDILLLQELIPATARSLKGELVDLYPAGQLYMAYEPEARLGIISRYPLTAINTTEDRAQAQKVLVQTPAGFIGVWNVHPRPPIPLSRQYRYLSAVARQISAVEGPLIVGGDFNTTDQSEAYGLINRYLHNAHWQAGWGFGFTFPARTDRFEGIPLIVPVIRIDHIFYSRHFHARHARTVPDSGGSDHYPVTAELSLVAP